MSRSFSPRSQNAQPGGFSRRGLLTLGAGAAITAMGRQSQVAAAEAAKDKAGVRKGRINQSVVAWCFRPLEIKQLAEHASQLGCKSVELVGPEHWDTLKKHGLVCAITPSHGFVRGLNDPANHAECIEKLTAAIEASGAAGFPNVITFSGMRGKLTDEEGKRNMVDGLKKVIGLAEKKRVNLCIEPLNTRVDVEMKGHPGYQCDTVEWAVDVCDRIGSPRLKILFDIYHTQIMQGDVIVRIRKYKDYIAHYHTAGVPGRNELDDRQEIHYPGVMNAIVETGYQGYVGQEFIPTGDDKIAALRKAVELCDV